MFAPATSTVDAFPWTPQPAAGALLRDITTEFLNRCPQAAHLARLMQEETGTRFFDWMDHITLPASEQMERPLKNAGFVVQPMPDAPRCFVHEQGLFPPVLLSDSPTTQVAIKVDSAADFLAVWQIPPEVPIEGQPLSPLRRARVFTKGSAELWVIERHGVRGFSSPRWEAALAVRAMEHLETFRRRQRDFLNEQDGFLHLQGLIDSAIADLGTSCACDLFFTAERDYWQRRNRAAQVQKHRQDALGLGWANHDHHTYRSSRQCFAPLVGLLESLGFVCRERFYAGAQAGWGAQVMEQTQAGIVVFADVDLAPEEVLGDFAHHPLLPRKELGTVGLWCALHGQAMLQAGMHHLECQFDFDALRRQLQEKEGIQLMQPFTDLPYLRQAFTEGQRWPVRQDRIDRLLEQGQITPAQANQFATLGAIGSHLENLERHDGFKGFNQEGISQIIAATDPRRHA